MLRPVLVVLLSLVCVAQSGCASFRTHRADDLRRIAVNPEAHRGELWAFYGRVIDAREDSTGLTIQMIVEDSPQFPGTLLVAHFPARLDRAYVVRGDNVSVLGRIKARVRGTNAFGGVSEGVGMDAIAVNRAYLPKEEETYRAWESGTLFSSR